MKRLKKITIAILLAIGIFGCTQKRELTSYVDPFIGSAATGHTFPGACLPFGLVQLSPDVETGGWKFCSGYHADNTSIIGFSHTHLNGTGGADLGDILIMPFSGEINIDKGTEGSPESGYRSLYRHETEKASPGYYGVTLDKNNIDVELTATERVGFHKYTFNQNIDMKVILDIDCNVGNNDVYKSELTFLNDSVAWGYKIQGGWAPKRVVYYALKFSKPVQAVLLRNDWVRNFKKGLKSNALKDSKVKVDGKIDANEWDLKNNIKKLVNGKTDNTASFEVKWDNTNLYIAAKVTDKKIVNDSKNPWEDDALEIYIDGNKSLVKKTNEFNRLITIRPNIEGFKDASDRKLSGLQKSSLTADGYIIEAAIEWASLGIKPIVGNKIGLDIAIDDDNNGDGRDAQIVWAGNSENWQNSENYGVITLTNEKGELTQTDTTSVNIDDFAFEKVAKSYVADHGISSALTFKNGGSQVLMIKTGISTTSKEAAIKAIENEIPDWNFEGVKAQANNKWNKALAKITIDAPDSTKTKFYTAMYHALIQPNIISDADGKFTGPDDKIHSISGGNFYSTFSLWDTYRAWNPLMTIIDTARVADMVNTLIYSFQFKGYLPRWPLWGSETECMIGNHAIPVIVDAYLKGIKGFDAEAAYKVLKASSLTVNPLSNWSVYNQYGYLPYDIEKTESVSKTLEMSFDDWCVAQMAKALGKNEDYEYFAKRAGFYKNVFDSTTNFMRGKDSKGQWVLPFDPTDLNHAGTGHGCYTEGNAWQHAWYVPQDVPGLISLMGGNKNFVAKLDSLFTIDSKTKGEIIVDVTGLIGQYAHGNEPSHHVAYLYNYAGEPWKTQEKVHQITSTLYTTKRDGLCGNDDCGQMSAWYILSSLGFYPVNPASGIYNIATPCLSGAKIDLGSGKSFVVKTVNYSSENFYVQSIKLNGKPYNNSWIKHTDIVNGGVLEFVMGKLPNKKWGVNAEDAPPASGY